MKKAMVFVIFGVFIFSLFLYASDKDTVFNDGGITVGDSDNTTAGTIRWTGSDFEGYDGSSWKSLSFSVSRIVRKTIRAVRNIKRGSLNIMLFIYRKG